MALRAPRSPITTSEGGLRRRARAPAALRMTSAPMPAGSPMLSAISGIIFADTATLLLQGLDVMLLDQIGFDPLLKSFLGLLGHQLFANRGTNLVERFHTR